MTVEVIQADRDAANKAFDIAFRGDTDGIDDAMAELLAAHRLSTTTRVDATDGEREADWWKPDPEDPFWMLEVRGGFDNAGAWVKNEHSGLTTRDAAKALRYPSRWAADCARKKLYPRDGQFEPTEHTWVALSRQPAAEADEVGSALDWLAGKHRLSLYHHSPTYCDDDDTAVEWRVDQENGSINDREWNTVGRGDTPIAAILSARTALNRADNAEGSGQGDGADERGEG